MSEKLSICILDDEIPTDELNDFNNSDIKTLAKNKIFIDGTKYIDCYTLKKCLNLEHWNDNPLKHLIESIMSNENYSVSAFKSHQYFFNYRNECLFSPNIVVFDWDTGTNNKLPEEHLETILKSIYCFVVIFSRCEKKVEIDSLLKSDGFIEFENRIIFIDKMEENVTQKIEEKISEYEKSFSFTSGTELRQILDEAISNVLTNMGKHSIEEIIKSFASGKSGQNLRLTNFEFMETIGEHFKSILIQKEFKSLIKKLETNDENINGGKNITFECNNEQFNDKVFETPAPNKKNPSDDEVNMARKLWRYRQYQTPNDDIVRKGDIIKIKKEKIKNINANEDVLYFVISSDCHLSAFYKKNLGYLTVVPIYRIDDEKIREQLKNYCSEQSIKQFAISSMTNPSKIGSITIFPDVFFNKEENNYTDGILLAKEVYSIKIDDKNKSDETELKYDETRLIGTGRLKLSEPFLTPVINFIINNITALGVPDFPYILTEKFALQVKNMTNEQ